MAVAGASSAIEELETVSSSGPHPLLMEDVLDKIFPYFYDPKNLGSFRLVNKIWNKSASRTVKKNLRWKLGSCQSENKFMKIMSNCTEDILGNFLWTHNEKTPNMNAGIHLADQFLRRSGRRRYLGDEWHRHVPAFLEKYGSTIVNLEIRARDPHFVDHRLRSSYLPNLEHLELYDLSEAVLTDEELFKEINSFGKLKSVCFNPKVFYLDDDSQHFNEGKAVIVDKILEAALQLKELEINLPKTTTRLLKGQQALALTALASLTRFTTSPPDSEETPANVALDKAEFQMLLDRCPNLKILGTSFRRHVKEDEVWEILTKSKICVQLEELHLSISDDMAFDDSDDDSSSDGSTMSDSSISDISSSDDEASMRAGRPNGNKPRRFATMTARPSLEILKARRLRFKRIATSLTLPKLPTKRKASSVPPTGAPDAKRNPDDPPDPYPFPQGLLKPAPRQKYLNYLGQKTKLPKCFPCPEMPKLKKLGLHWWRLNSFDLFYNKPFLREVDLIVRYAPFLVVPILAPLLDANPSVKYLKCRDANSDFLHEDGIEALAELFPNLEELDVKVDDDETLKSIFQFMTELKRLDLNNSQMSDSGITGISARKLKKAFEQGLPLEEAAKLRVGPHLGNLKDLQHFAYTGHSLTKYSVHYGITELKNLTNLKFTVLPWRDPYYSKFMAHESTSEQERILDIRPILTNCKYLVKLDVNGANIDDEDSDFTDDSDVEDQKPTPNFKGCGLKLDQIHHVKKEFPNLDLVFGEKAEPRK